MIKTPLVLRTLAILASATRNPREGNQGGKDD